MGGTFLRPLKNCVLDIGRKFRLVTGRLLITQNGTLQVFFFRSMDVTTRDTPLRGLVLPVRRYLVSIHSPAQPLRRVARVLIHHAGTKRTPLTQVFYLQAEKPNAYLCPRPSSGDVQVKEAQNKSYETR